MDERSCCVILPPNAAGWRGCSTRAHHLLPADCGLRLPTVGKQPRATLWSSAGMRTTEVQSHTCHTGNSKTCLDRNPNGHGPYYMFRLTLSTKGETVPRKGKVPLCLINYVPRHEDVWGSGGIALRFLISALDEGDWSASRPGRFTPQGTSPRYPLDRRLGGPQSLSGLCGEEENRIPAGNRTPAVQPLDIPTELSRHLSN
jgi:hypothetical protein